MTESVYRVPGDEGRFHAAFTTPTTGLRGSAICTFRLSDIDHVFASGRFKEQATSSSAWLPVLSSRVPQPRPGTCVNDTHSLPGTHTETYWAVPNREYTISTSYYLSCFIKTTYVALNHTLPWNLNYIILSYILDAVINFIRSHPLMDAAIPHEYGKPVFYLKNVIITRIVIDYQKTDFGKHFIIYYAGTG